MSSKVHVRVFQLIVGIILLSFLAGCGALTPEFTYQGKLTDENGTPLNGSFTITYKLFDALTGGNEIHTETNTVTVTDGLFESVIGPSSALGTLDPQDLTQPLYIELTISDGTVTETLEPRQHLYGAPYAFTLMPGSVISGELNTTLFGGSNVKSVVTIQNPYNGTPSDPALPALRVIGDTGIELAAPFDPTDPDTTDGEGFITSDLSKTNSDLVFSSQDEVQIYLDSDNNSGSSFTVYNGEGTIVFQVRESGAFYLPGTSVPPITPSSIEHPKDQSPDDEITMNQTQFTSTDNQTTLREDVGSGTLENGLAEIPLSAEFAALLNSNDYHVFITPLGDCNGLFVAEKSENSFIVKELGSGTSNVSFDYRIVSKLADKE